MVTRLSRPGTEAPAENAASAAGKTPPGWGKSAGKTDAPAGDTQRGRIQDQIGGQGGDNQDEQLPDRSGDAARAFGRRSAPPAQEGHSNGVRTDGEEAAAPAPRTRRTRQAAAPAAAELPLEEGRKDSAPRAAAPAFDLEAFGALLTNAAAASSKGRMELAAATLMASIVNSDPTASVEDILLTFDDLAAKVFAPF